MPNLVSFAIILLVSTFTPGPNNIFSMTKAAQVGFRKSFRVNLGMYTGFIVIISLVMAFNFYLAQALPAIKPILQIIGTDYILGLALSIVLSQKKDQTRSESAAGNFLTGFFMQFVNPKLYIFSLTMISAFITPYYSDPVVLAGFVLLQSTTGFIATCSWGLFGSLFNQLFVKKARTMNIILAVLLAGSALSLYL